MKIGVYVGSFDPIHKGHKSVVNHLINNYLDRVIIIPTGNYWNKQDITLLSHREKMIKLSFNNDVIIDSNLSKYEFTYQIMEKLREVYSNDDLYLIIGADNIVDFYKWKNVESILKSYVLIIPRNNIDVSLYLEKYKDRFILVKDFEMKDISSTFIRECFKKDNVNLIENILDKSVIKYIVNNNLYKS